MPLFRTVDDLDRDQLAVLAREHLLAGHLIDRAGMPTVIGHGVDVMRDVAIDEWMGASPLYTARMQRLLGFEGDTVEVCFKGMQLDIGAPPEFMDFRFTVIDDHHGEFHLDHCGALMDVEPMGEEFVVAMCHHIEDPTFDATGWATNPRLTMRPRHRPPRRPADRQPHCAWTVTIDPDAEPTAAPGAAGRIGRTLAAQLPLAVIAEAGDDDGLTDYAGSFDPDLRLGAFARSALRALVDEVCLQGHLLVLSFAAAVGDRFGPDAAVDAVARQFTGVAGVAADRLRRAFGLGAGAADLATVYALHPAFLPRAYVDWRVTAEGEAVHLELGDCPARHESGVESWIRVLADGNLRPLQAIATAVDPHWSLREETPGRWTVERTGSTHPELDEVTLTRFSTGAAFDFRR